MYKRKDTDRNIIEEAIISTTELRNWIEGLFGGLSVDKDIFKWAENIMVDRYSKVEDKKRRKMILVKILHTSEVVQAGVDIADEDMDRRLVELVCFLHDVGRFDQALLGSFSDSGSNFDHADEGAKLIEKASFEKLKGTEKEIVVEAVRCHSRKHFDGDNRYAKLARDADKLAICRYVEELMGYSGLDFNGKMTEEAWQDYSDGRMIEHAHVKTGIDAMLRFLSWQWDLNLEKTKSCFENDGFWNWVFAQVRVGVTDEEYERVVSRFNQPLE